jgi:hypothetical protein
MNRAESYMVLLVAGAVGAIACVNGTLPRRDVQHPGHPSAPEGYAAAEIGATAQDAKHDRSGDSQAEAAVYACPMHAEVVSSTPGTCPKCGMKLVPKPSPPKQSPSATP